MYALYNHKTKKYAYVEARLSGGGPFNEEPASDYYFSQHGTLYTSDDRETLEKILARQGGKDDDKLGDLHRPFLYHILEGFSIVQMHHVQTLYRISTVIDSGYEVEHREFDGTIEQCREYMDTKIREASRNGLLKDINLKIDGEIHRSTLYDVLSFVMTHEEE